MLALLESGPAVPINILRSMEEHLGLCTRAIDKKLVAGSVLSCEGQQTLDPISQSGALAAREFPQHIKQVVPNLVPL